jgi:hypothetical protein
VGDLGEHTGTILTILGGTVCLLGVLIGVIWNDIKKDMGKLFRWQLDINTQHGAVTWDKQLEWCKNCENMNSILQWRTEIFQKGGVVTRVENDVFIEKTMGKIEIKIDNLFRIHRDLKDQIRTDVQKAITGESGGRGSR